MTTIITIIAIVVSFIFGMILNKTEGGNVENIKGSLQPGNKKIVEKCTALLKKLKVLK